MRHWALELEPASFPNLANHCAPPYALRLFSQRAVSLSLLLRKPSRTAHLNKPSQAPLSDSIPSPVTPISKRPQSPDAHRAGSELLSRVPQSRAGNLLSCRSPSKLCEPGLISGEKRRGSDMVLEQ